MTGMTPERLQAIEDRLPGKVFPHSVEHDVLNLLDEVRRLRAENDDLRAGVKSFVRQINRLANGIERVRDEAWEPWLNRDWQHLDTIRNDCNDLLNPTEGEANGN